VLSCFKLNPYEHLNLRFDSSVDDVKRQYRKARARARRQRGACQADALACVAQISLMVHPDKCKHPRAREAFEGAPCSPARWRCARPRRSV
jgi:DnaJ family protein C protein 8